MGCPHPWIFTPVPLPQFWTTPGYMKTPRVPSATSVSIMAKVPVVPLSFWTTDCETGKNCGEGNQGKIG